MDDREPTVAGQVVHRLWAEGSVNAPYYLPPDIFRRLTYGRLERACKFNDWFGCRVYTSEAVAVVDLSRACVSLGRARAGLPGMSP